MAIAKQGQIIERRWKSGRAFAIRVHAYGSRHYVTLGSERDGWTRRGAEEELANAMADVRRGRWVPPAGRAKKNGARERTQEGEPTFHVFASGWLHGRRGEVADRTLEFYEWALGYHLLPYFAHHRLSEITIEAVDAYRRLKVTQSEERRRRLEAPTPGPARTGCRARSRRRRSTRRSMCCTRSSRSPWSTGTWTATPPPGAGDD